MSPNPKDGSIWGDYYPNNMPPTADQFMYPGYYQQNPVGMGSYSGQRFSGYPSQIVPNGTTQRMTADPRQQFGSNPAFQGQFGSATSATNGGNHFLYAMPQQGFGQMASHQKPPYQNFAQQNLGGAPQQMDFQQTPPDQTFSQQFPGYASQQTTLQQTTFQQKTLQQATLDQNFSQQYPANAPQQDYLPLDYPQTAPEVPHQAYTNVAPAPPLDQASGQQAAQAQYPPQPQHQPKSQDKPQEPKLTFEERLKAFRPVPPPQSEPVRNKGRGRKKKMQRFWAPQGANDRVKEKYERLQTVDGRVDIALKKLNDNTEVQNVKHLQEILLRNMREREDLWTECERLQQGLIAIERELSDAEEEAKKAHKAWKESCQRVSEREAELMQANVPAVQDDNSEDAKKRKKKERESLQSMVNWRKNKWFALQDALESLSFAIVGPLGGDYDHARADRVDEAISHAHRLGIYEGFSHYMWPGDSELSIWNRKNFSNPDPATWSLILPPHLCQQQAQHGQVGQPGHDQSAQQPPVNYAPVAASVQMGHLPDADDVQMDFSDAQNGQGQQQPHIQEDPMIEEDQEGLSDITEEAALAEIEAFNRGQEQLNLEEMFPLAQTDEAPPQVEDYSRQQGQLPQEEFSVYTDGEVTDMFGPIHQEQQQPHQSGTSRDTEEGDPAQIEPSNKEQEQLPQEDYQELTDEQVAYIFGPYDQEQQQPHQSGTSRDTEEGGPAQIEPSNPEQGHQAEVPALSHEEVAAAPGAINQEQQQPQQGEMSAATREKHLALANWKAEQQVLKYQEMLMKTPEGRTALRSGVGQRLQKLQQLPGPPVANEEPAPVVQEISPPQSHLPVLSAPFTFDPADEDTNMSADAAAAIDELYEEMQQKEAGEAHIPEEAQQQDTTQDQDAAQDDDGSEDDMEGIEFEEVPLPPMPTTGTTLLPPNPEAVMTRT